MYHPAQNVAALFGLPFQRRFQLIELLVVDQKYALLLRAHSVVLVAGIGFPKLDVCFALLLAGLIGDLDLKRGLVEPVLRIRIPRLWLQCHSTSSG